MLALIPGNGSKTRGEALTIFALLGEYPFNSAPGRVDRKVDGAGGSIVDGDKYWRSGDGVLEFLHGVMLPHPGEVGIFAGEVDERAGKG